ncbi:hypothetical protein [Mycobacterium sp. SMC-4]|uniref:hypothetical protein n=1 Tax=Mycobacterium sp. SMC-4 TaxID=2857059 RepID=UPI0021B487C1|nr:hypothetical protein [Mycobacterium sp. SMC-4]UXA19090.1 hypothetical protein KXD98_05405 [Mycobacterium sp. SMC-4]
MKAGRDGAVPPPAAQTPSERDDRLAWFEAFLADRGTRKPSAQTMKAYRQDFDAIAALIVGDKQPIAIMPLDTISTELLRTAFAGYAATREAASIRCCSTWNFHATNHERLGLALNLGHMYPGYFFTDGVMSRGFIQSADC